MLLAIIFAGLSLLHVYWAAGGSFGGSVSIPSLEGKRVIDPSPLVTMIVAAALFVAAVTILGRLGWFKAIPQRMFRWPTATIAVVFFIRAIGDFRLVGFFKHENASDFAYWDTWLFSPLCVLIAGIAFLLSIREV